MSEARNSTIALGLRACKGGAIGVALAVDAGTPQLLASVRIATARADDRLALEPYAVAAQLPRGPDGRASAEAQAAVAEGRRRQEQAAAAELRALSARLAPAPRTRIVVALLVNRAGWITDLLDYSLDWAEHVPVAELLGVREALRGACRACGLERVDVDEKSLPERAADMFAVTPAAIDAQLKALGAVAGAPWRKEHKLAALAAWFALARAPA